MPVSFNDLLGSRAFAPRDLRLCRPSIRTVRRRAVHRNQTPRLRSFPPLRDLPVNPDASCAPKAARAVLRPRLSSPGAAARNHFHTRVPEPRVLPSWPSSRCVRALAGRAADSPIGRDGLRAPAGTTPASASTTGRRIDRRHVLEPRRTRPGLARIEGGAGSTRQQPKRRRPAPRPRLHRRSALSSCPPTGAAVPRHGLGWSSTGIDSLSRRRV